jgi:hypothetical protein
MTANLSTCCVCHPALAFVLLCAASHAPHKHWVVTRVAVMYRRFGCTWLPWRLGWMAHGSRLALRCRRWPPF